MKIIHFIIVPSVLAALITGSCSKDVTDDENYQMNKRIEYLDIMKGIAIILVVIGHCCELPAHPTLLAKFIYSFHMPLFFIASGMVVKPAPNCGLASDWKAVLKRFTVLMVPYFIWCMIYMDCTGENFGRMFYASFQSIKASGAECRQMWFLPCLFVCEIMIHVLLRITGNFKTASARKIFLVGSATASFVIGFLLPKLEGGYPFNVNVAFVALGIMLVGYLGKEFIGKLDSRPVIYQFLFFAISAVLLYVGVMYGSKGFMMSMCIASYGPVFWFLWNACFGVIMIRSLSSIISKISSGARLNVLKRASIWMGRNTMGVYLLHMPLCFSLMKWMTDGLGLSVGTSSGNLVAGLVVSAAATLLTIVVNAICPQLLGRGKYGRTDTQRP